MPREMTQPAATKDDSPTALSDTQLLVSGLWAEVLERRDEVKDQENFFEIGGDSLTMMMMLFRIKEEIGVELAPADLMASPTLASFSSVVHLARERQRPLVVQDQS